MRFFCFPKRQDHFIIYSSLRAFWSQLFSDLILQASSKNSIFFRVRRTLIGHVFGHFSKMILETPDQGPDFVGIVKKGNTLLISITNGEPRTVWRQINNGWEQEPFLGYQLISEYSFKEFSNKKELIKNALEQQWDRILENRSNIHGDFTHFNILIGNDGNIHFIDRKEMKNSILFDFFYFYAYLRQCLYKCSTLTKGDENQIVKELDELLLSICQQNSHKTQEDLLAIQIPKVCGLIDSSKQELLEDFKSIFRLLE